MLSEKAPFEELDEKNQKKLQKIVGKFLYYAGAIEPKMLMALNFLEMVQTKPTIETAKQIKLDALTSIRKSGIILRICLDAP